jgi:SAM-dependent methyltransferase
VTQTGCRLEPTMESESEGLRLHLGCGHRILPGFVNVDIHSLPHVDHVRNVDDLGIFPDGVASLVYASHVLEYFDRQRAEEVIREWSRVLAPGGVLRIAVPDFDALSRVYQRTGRLTDILGPLFGRMSMVDEAGLPDVLYHKTVWNRVDLSTALLSAGLVSVQEWDWRTVPHGGIDDHSQAYFPHMDKEGGIHVSLNLEGTKPTPRGL